MHAIETSNLTKTFPNGRGIKDLTISVNEGEVLSLLGVNGAGKTTTVRMLSAMIIPSSGSAQIFGKDVSKSPSEIHSLIGLLTETPGFYEKMSVEANLRFFAGFYDNIDAERQIEKYLSIFNLKDRRKEAVSSLSKGLKQRLAICRAMAHEPKILFFDEPTSGLDPESALGIRKIIKDLRREGRTILLCTHNLTEADELSDRIAIVNGRLLEMQTSSELKKKYFKKTLLVKSSDAKSENLERVRKILSMEAAVEDGNFIIDINDRPDDVKSEIVKLLIGGGIDVREVFEKEYSLEDAYMKVMTEERNR